MTKIKHFLKWTFGIGLSILGLAMMFSASFIGGFLYLAGGFILFPPTLKIIEGLLGSPLSRAVKYIAVIGCIIIGSSYIANKHKEDKALFDNLPRHVKDSLNLIKAKQDSTNESQRRLTTAKEDSIKDEEQKQERIAKYQEQKEESAKDREEKVKKQFNPWDGSHIKLTRYIKEHMNDPDSYDHIETRFGDEGDYILVVAKFRGANAFGGKVINTVTAKVDIDGEVLEIVSQK